MAKIIGKGAGDTFIIEMTPNELANLLGYYSKYQVPGHGGRDQCGRVGEEIRIAEMYSWLTGIAGLEEKLQQARGILTAVAGGLTMVDPLVRQVNAVTAKKEG